MRVSFLSIGALALAGTAEAGPVDVSPRPPSRQEAVMVVQAAADKQQGLEAWLAGFRLRAGALGIGQGTLDTALRGVAYASDVIRRDQNQSEFTKTIWDYLDSAASDERIANGQAALARHLPLLERIEARYGVEKEIVVAVWGLESAYGTFRGDLPLIPSLATLAYDGRRGAFFEAQLVAALKIIQNGDVAAEGMTGSWAGAMGHTQFIPTSYLESAVDFTGDGKRDIWSDDPTDALASTAAYLAKAGWQTGRPWGVEITLPEGFDYTQTGDRVKKPVAEWQAMGVRSVQDDLADHGPASVLLPGGAKGAAFLIFRNFNVIERYNTADAYVIGVGHLADRIGGGPAITADWPREDRALVLDERVEMQERLTKAGFSPGAVDGKIGPNTIAAVMAFQRAKGLVPDGYPSLDILTRLR